MTQPISVARLGDLRPDLLPRWKAKDDPGAFALGGKGLASGAGVANARNNKAKFTHWFTVVMPLASCGYLLRALWL